MKAEVSRKGKLVLLDCLIAAAFFLILVTFTCQTAIAGTAGYYYVLGTQNNRQIFWYGVQGYQRTVSVSVSSGSEVFSFVDLVKQAPAEQFAVGFMQGVDPNTGQWLSTPYYYVDRVKYGSYAFWHFEQAPVGTDHFYCVYCDSTGSSISASIDGVTKKTEGGYSSGARMADAETEVHNTDDVMNHHLWNLKSRPVESRWFLFHDTFFHHDSPFKQNIISGSEWYAYK